MAAQHKGTLECCHSVLINYILIIHIALLLLASTNFTVLTFVGESTSFTWNYYTYASRSGFGYEYVSAYSLPQVLAYIAAYAAGLVVFKLVLGIRFRWINLIGFILCILGLLSFTIEGSHWLYDHNRSWIVSFPIVLICIWIYLFIFIRKELQQDLTDETEQEDPNRPAGAVD